MGEEGVFAVEEVGGLVVYLAVCEEDLGVEGGGAGVFFLLVGVMVVVVGVVVVVVVLDRVVVVLWEDEEVGVDFEAELRG